MSRRRALSSGVRALAITGVIGLGVLAAIALTSGAPVAPAGGVVVAAQRAVSQSDAAARRAALPLYFEPNVGQSDGRVRFLSHSSRYSLFLTDAGAVFSLVGGQIHKGPSVLTVNPRPSEEDRLVESAVQIRMIGANPRPRMTALEALPGRVNYLIGSDPSKFHRNVPTYGRVRVSDVYPGIDVVYYGMPASLEYDIVAAPGADTSLIRVAIQGEAKTVVEASGNIEIATAAGMIAMHKPHAYQRAANGSEVPVECWFAAAKRGASPEYAIKVGRYDRTRPLIIDPTVQILYSSFLGGSASSTGPVKLEQFSGITGNAPLTVADVGTDVALDPTNKAYVTGTAFSNNFPLLNPLPGQNSQNGDNSPPNQNPVGFISKFDTTKSGAASLVYSTYIGGAGDSNPADAGHGNGDLPFGIAVDASGEAFIVGQTYSTDFPSTNTCGAFGKTNDQKATDVNVGFVAKLNSSGSGIVYACYIDGQNNATEARVALYPAGCDAGVHLCKAYVAGSTQSDHTTGFPSGTVAPYSNTLKATGGKSSATFIVVHEDGQSLDYATLFGGSGNGTNAEAATGVTFNNKNARGYITGATFSSDLPTLNPAVAAYNAGASAKKVSNVFVAEFDPTVAGGGGVGSLKYATYLGGSGATGTITPIIGPAVALSIGDIGTAIKIDGATGHIWVAGTTASSDFQVPGKVLPIFQSTNQAAMMAGAPATAGFITELDLTQAGLNQVRYSTYFGGGGTKITAPLSSGSIGVGDAIVDFQITGGTLLYVTGATASGSVANGFPTSAHACQTLNKTSGISFKGIVSVPITAFAAEIDPSQSTSAAQLAFSTLLGGTGTADAGTGLAIDSSGDMVISGLTYSGDFPVTTTAFQSANGATGAGATNAFLSVLYPLGTNCANTGGTPVPTITGSPSPSPSPSPTPTPGPGGSITISSNPVVFPNAGVGAAPTNKSFLIQNLSLKRHLVGNVGSPKTASFAITSGAGAFDLGPLGVGKVKMRFMPSGTGLQKDSLTITSSDKNDPALIVRLRGTGEPGRLTTNITLLPPLFQPILAFGRVSHNGAMKSLSFRIKNIGIGVVAGNVPVLGGTFTVTAGSGAFNLAPGAKKLITVQFMPSSVGRFNQPLVITVTPPGKPVAGVTVLLRGRGT